MSDHLELAHHYVGLAGRAHSHDRHRLSADIKDTLDDHPPPADLQPEAEDLMDIVDRLDYQMGGPALHSHATAVQHVALGIANRLRATTADPARR